MPIGQDVAKAKLDNLIKGYGEEVAIDWLRCKFPSFETGSARKISIGESKGEKDYLASARLLGHITRLPEKGGDAASNRPLVVVAVEMKGDMTERTSRAGQFAFAKRVLRDAVNSGATGLDGLPSQGLFFFHDANGAFRISLVTGEVEGRRFKFNEAKRQSFFVRPGAANNIIRRRFHDPVTTFIDLKEAFSVEQLTKEFYRELFNWYEWAKDSGACFPNILNEQKDPKKEKQYNHEAIIRLITRLMFTWFIRQRNLVPDVLFDRKGVRGILKKFNFDSMVEDNYYRAILQNLFFATFNTPQFGKDKLTRRWIVAKTDARGNGVGLTSDYHVTTVYRYKDEFKDSDGFLAMMRKVPFLNCALFDCLDKIESKEDGGRRMYFDGFSMKHERRARVPNGLFFGDGEEGHMGIITLFDQYEFTIDENEVNDGDVALDPELLGKVFENLLGAYNPETQATARNATGSFYTPREIVDYMVEESLKNYLRGKLSLDEKDSRLNEFFDKGKAAEKAPTGFSREEEKAILEALYACRIIDPACGSGAFPMGILNCMVRLLKRLDDDTGTSIREYLLKRYREDKDRRDPTETEEDRQERLEEIEKRFAEGKMYPDYARKLYLIENCIYGVDIQPIAAQISKLRFFISLLCDQFRTSYNPESDNYGLLSLPNLEAKFVCANTLIALPDAGGELDLTTGKVGELRDELVLNRHKIFGARSTKTKEKYKAQDKKIRCQIREAVRDGLSKPDAGKIAQIEKMIEQAKKRRKEVEKPNWVEVERPVQQEFFVATSSQPMLMKIDRNEDKRNDIDREIDKCKSEIEKEQAKGGRENVDAATKYSDLVAGWDPFDQNASSPFFDPEWMFNIKDGFDIVIGNPPYGADLGKEGKAYCMRTYTSAKTISGKQKGSCDSYSLFVERAYLLTKINGNTNFILPMAIVSSASMIALHKILYENCAEMKCSSYAVRPQPVFENACVNTTILLFRKTETPLRHFLTTKMYRKGKSSVNLEKLIRNLEFVDSIQFLLAGRVPKIGSAIEANILGKLFACKTIKDYLDEHGDPVYYRAAGGRYFKVITNYSTHSSAEKFLLVSKKYRNAICCILSSSLSFWFYQIFSDNLNWKTYEIHNMRLPIMDEILDKLGDIYSRYLIDIESHAKSRISSAGSTYHVEEFKEYKIGYSKPIIDQIDDLIGPLYGLTREEITFIKNYEIEFRMGDYLSDEEIAIIEGRGTKSGTGDGVDLENDELVKGASQKKTVLAKSRETTKHKPEDIDDEILD